MKENLDLQPDYIEKYLLPGEQTQITPKVKEIAENFSGSTSEKVEQIFNKISSLEQRGFDDQVFRQRTAGQIIADDYVTGCTDFALVFIVLARASGIPAKYVETINKEWLRTGGDLIGGHIYSQIYDKEESQWRWVDPMRRIIDMSPEARVVFKEGLDSWDIGIKDFDSLKSSFEEFRNRGGFNFIDSNQKQ